MSDSVKIAAIVTAGTLLLFGSIFVSCNVDNAIAAKAPVVETCIKHPSTRNPIRGAQ